MRVLVTGAAGFIGSHVTRALLDLSYDVVGVDNFNNYYDPNLKRDRIKSIREKYPSYTCLDWIGIEGRKEAAWLFNSARFDVVINLAAQAGVRYSKLDPESYIDSNIVGFANILESCKATRVPHVIYASSSSVYGDNGVMKSLYAATKKSNELMAEAYCNQFDISCTGLRFFTVYGPWGRPDMAYYSFTKNILEGTPIEVYNYGNMTRDFTYIDDVVNCIVSMVQQGPKNKNAVYDVGNGTPVRLMDLIHEIEENVGRQAVVKFLSMDPSDVENTKSDSSNAARYYGYSPKVDVRIGVKKFVDWYKGYHK